MDVRRSLIGLQYYGVLRSVIFFVIFYISTEALRFEFVNSGAISALVDCLSLADTGVQCSAMQALGMLSCDSIARQQLLECNGVPPLLLCLQSPSGELVQKTAWTIAIVAQSSQVSAAIGQLGYVCNKPN